MYDKSNLRTRIYNSNAFRIITDPKSERGTASESGNKNEGAGTS